MKTNILNGSSYSIYFCSLISIGFFCMCLTIRNKWIYRNLVLFSSKQNMKNCKICFFLILLFFYCIVSMEILLFSIDRIDIKDATSTSTNDKRERERENDDREWEERRLSKDHCIGLTFENAFTLLHLQLNMSEYEYIDEVSTWIMTSQYSFWLYR